MDKPKIRVDFNEIVEENLILLSAVDTKCDSEGNVVELSEGLKVSIYDVDCDESGNPDNLVASGVVERNCSKGWSAHVRWCCRIDDNGIRHTSEVDAT